MPTYSPLPLTKPVAPANSRPGAPSQPIGHKLARNFLALWHLLSLDAPTVATVWTLYIAYAAHLHLPTRVPIAMFLAVWMLYASDRLLDARLLDARLLDARLLDARLLASTPVGLRGLGSHALPAFDSLGLQARHFFHHRHRRPFLAGVAVCVILLAALVPRLNPAAIRLNLILGSLLFVYFVLIHVTGSTHRLPKEISVGLFFSAAVFIPTIARAPLLRPGLLPIALLFATLCSLNGLFISHWEHAPHRRANRLREPHHFTRTGLRYLTVITVILAVAGLALASATHRTTPVPIALAALLLLGLHRRRDRLAPLTLRAAADLVLLTPLPFLLLGHTG